MHILCFDEIRIEQQQCLVVVGNKISLDKNKFPHGPCFHIELSTNLVFSGCSCNGNGNCNTVPCHGSALVIAFIVIVVRRFCNIRATQH